MENNRPTKTITLAITKLPVVVKTYATAREARAIEGVFFKKTQVGVDNGSPTMKDIDLSMVQEVELETIRQLVVSIGDTSEKVAMIELILDQPNEDYKQLLAELDSLTKKKS